MLENADGPLPIKAEVVGLPVSAEIRCPPDSAERRFARMAAIPDESMKSTLLAVLEQLWLCRDDVVEDFVGAVIALEVRRVGGSVALDTRGSRLLPSTPVPAVAGRGEALPTIL